MLFRSTNWSAENVIVVNSVSDAIQKARDLNFKEIFIIGGGEIYKESMHLANRIYLTKVHTSIEGDTFFPELETEKWNLLSNKDFKSDEKHVFDYSFQIWERVG